MFLLQNLFPVTEKYIKAIYLDRIKKGPVSIEDKLFNDIYYKFCQIIELVRKGNKNIVFPDILEIEQKLLEELRKEE